MTTRDPPVSGEIKFGERGLLMALKSLAIFGGKIELDRNP